MARTLAQAFVEIRGDTSKIGGDLKSGLQRPAEEAGRDAGKRIADNVNKSVSGISFGGVIKQAAGFAAVLGAGGIVGQAAKMGIQTAAALQQAQVGFTTLIGSGTKAQDFLKQLSAFAAATPFELHGLVDSSRLLLGVGVSSQQVIPMLTAFGDAAGAVGVGQDAFQRIMLATSQAISAGRFQTADLNQITENGIPVWKLLSEAMGKPVPELRKMAEHGQLLSDKVLPVLQKQMEKDYGGSMAKQSQTLAGVWSTLQDTVSIGLANALQPLVPMLTQLLPRAADLAGKALGLLSIGFADAITFARELIGWLRQHQTLAVTVASALGGLVAAVGLYSAAVRVASGLTTAWRSAVALYRGIVFLTIAATQGWTAAQAALDGVLIANPIGLVVVAIAALVAGFILAYQHSATFRAIVQAALRDVAEAGRWMWENVLRPAFTALVGFWQGTLVPAALFLWHSVIEPAFRGIAAVATWLWTNILHPYFTAWQLIIRDVIIPVILVLWHNVVQPAFQGIKLIIEVAWVAIRIVFGLIEAYIKYVLAPLFTWLWKNVVVPAWDAIKGQTILAWNIFKTVISDAWGFVHPIFVAIGDIIKNDVAPKFKLGVEAIGKAWDAIREMAAVPVRFMVNTVINKGIIGAWNWIHDHLKVGSHIDPISLGFAGGGRLPGSPSAVDNMVARGPDGRMLGLATGEYVVNAQQTARHLPLLEAINSGMQGFADGGLIGLITNPIGWLKDRIDLSGFGSGPFSDLVGGVGRALVDQAVGAVKGLIGSGLGAITSTLFGGGKGGSGQVDQWIAAAIAITGAPASWLPGLHTLVMRESGGNPNSINLTDINAQHGDPSRGLAQTIGATFARYHQAGTSSNIFDPVANVAAAINYIRAVYGDLSRVQQANPSLPPKGYALGGLMMPDGRIPTISMDSGRGVLQPGANIVLNGTGRQEPIAATPGRLDEYTIARLGQEIAFAISRRPIVIEGPNDLGLSVAGIAP